MATGRSDVITSAQNPKLRLVRRLLASRSQRERQGLFVAEGEDLLASAREAGIEPVELLVAGESVAPEVIRDLSTLGHPARVLAVFRRDALPSGARDVTVALWHVADPGNVGTLLRSADAFGAGIALSPGCADPTGPKAVRASAGAVFRVPLIDFAEVAAPLVALVSRGGTPLAELQLGSRATFVLGAEREGLPDQVLARCDERATIPQPGEAESLNVAMAGTIALYEFVQRRSAPGESSGPR